MKTTVELLQTAAGDYTARLAFLNRGPLTDDQRKAIFAKSGGAGGGGAPKARAPKKAPAAPVVRSRVKPIGQASRENADGAAPAKPGNGGTLLGSRTAFEKDHQSPENIRKIMEAFGVDPDLKPIRFPKNEEDERYNKIVQEIKGMAEVRPGIQDMLDNWTEESSPSGSTSTPAAQLPQEIPGRNMIGNRPIPDPKRDDINYPLPVPTPTVPDPYQTPGINPNAPEPFWDLIRSSRNNKQRMALLKRAGRRLH